MINLRDIEQKSVKDMKFSHVYISKLETAFFLFQFPRECISPSEVLQYRDQFYRRILSTDRANDTVNGAPYPNQLQTRYYDETIGIGTTRTIPYEQLTQFAQTALRLATILQLTNPPIFNNKYRNTPAPTPVVQQSTNNLFTINNPPSTQPSGARIDNLIAAESVRSRSRMSSNQETHVSDIVDPEQARKNEIIRFFANVMLTFIKALIPERELSYGMTLFGINYNAFNNDGGLIHPYYKCKILHMVTMTLFLKSGHIAAQELFNNGISHIPSVCSDSSEQLMILRDNFLNLKYEIDLIAAQETFPVTVWKNNFAIKISNLDSGSFVREAMKSVMIDPNYHRMDFNEYLSRITDMVINMEGLMVPNMAPAATPIGSNNAEIQLQYAATTNNTDNRTCSFCQAVKRLKYPTIKTDHKSDNCYRKTRPCDVCCKLPRDPSDFHYSRDCPKWPTLLRIKESGNNRHSDNNPGPGHAKHGKRTSDGKPYPKEKRFRVNQTIHDDEYDDVGDIDDEQSDDEAAVINQSQLYSHLILDSGANRNTVTPTMAQNHQKYEDNLYIYGIGNLKVKINESVTINDIKHHVIANDMGIVSISDICTRFNITVVFDKHNVQFMSADKQLVHLTCPLRPNGLYTIEYEQYKRLLNQLACHNITNQTPPRIHLSMTRFTITKEIERYIIELHEMMGHSFPEKMCNTISSGIIIPNPPPNSANLLFNRDILCRLIAKYYTKRRCLECEVIYAKQIIRNQPNITYYPTMPFEEVSFDFKPADIKSYDGMIGTIIAACSASMYAMHYPVSTESGKQTLDALKYFIQVANSYQYKISRIRYDAAKTNNTQQILRYLNTRGITTYPIAVGRQQRNFVEKVNDLVYRRYNVIHASQYLLNITYWTRGLDTAVSYHNSTTNIRCPEYTPHRKITGQQPRIQQYTYGQPVLINRQEKHFTKNVHFPMQNRMAIVIRIDNTIPYGVQVISCATGLLSAGYYDLIVPIKYNKHNQTEINNLKQKFSIYKQQPITRIIDAPPDSLRFSDMTLIPLPQTIPDVPISIPTQLIQDNINPSNPIDPPLNDDHDTIRHIAQQPSAVNNEIATINAVVISNKIVPYMSVQKNGEVITLSEAEYMNIPIKERQPKMKQIQHLNNYQQWLNVTIDEITKWDENNVGEIVERSSIPRYKRAIPIQLVYTYKQKLLSNNSWGYTPKCRGAGRGDLEPPNDDDNEDTYYAPTTYISTVMTLLALATQQEWKISTFDVIGAFLKTPIEEEIYVSLPSQIMTNQYIIRLKKYLYGLKKANNKFNEHFHQILLRYGLQVATTDICLYYNDRIRCAIFVDDGLLTTNNTDTRDHFLQYLDQQIGIDAHNDPKQFLKLELQILPDKLLIHQQTYINLLNIPEPSFTKLHDFMPIKFNHTRPIPNTYEELRLQYIQSPHCCYIPAKQVQEIVGALVWVIYSTRGDLQIIGHYLAKSQSNPTEFDLFMAYNTYRYLKNDSYRPIVYTKSNNMILSLISDGAHLKNITDTVLGQLGYVIILGFCTVIVSSTSAERPTRSASETEMLAGSNGLAQLTYVSTMLQELGITIDATHYYTDCLSILKLINRKKQISKKARHFINEIAQFKLATTNQMSLQLYWVPTLKMIADALTKLKIDGKLKRVLSDSILNGQLFFQHQYTNVTNNKFKNLRFSSNDQNHSDNLNDIHIQYLNTQYDSDPNYFNELWTI